MKPHLEEAFRTLRLADRDIAAFQALINAQNVHFSMAGFHAQQAIEKSLKAVLFSQKIEFDRSHDLVKLAGLLRDNQIYVPIQDKDLRKINPFAVTMRYDELEITMITPELTANLVQTLREWAEQQVKMAVE